ncbi:hypothetical protein [Lutibacter sp.]|uniref:hypothetical protein n=1 Tax=Lutibacter sp. TaxID=1925666 RepID=UPI00349FDE48
MKKTQFLLLATILFFSISCKNTTEKKPEQDQPQDAIVKVKLNNGKLWEANSETTDGINAMLQLMNNFSEDESPKSYATLKQSLVKEFKTIIQKCTMTDEAHDQLHVFIMPMRALFNGLTDSDMNIRKENFNKINAHLKTYKNYFE